MTANHHPAYRPDIDGLRAVAVMAVVLFHAFPTQVAGGFIGVDIFFVISGFLISSILMKEHEAGQFSYAGFYARRIRRIFPALILVLAFCYVLGWFSLFADEFAQLGKHVAGGGLFSANLVLWHEAGYFDQASEQKLLLHLWSLGIEEQFYIVWPILLGLLWKPRWTVVGMAVLFGFSFLANVMLVGINKTATFYFPLTRFWELLAGAMLAWLQLRRPDLPGRHGNLQSLAGLALLAAGLYAIHETRAFPGYWALLPVLGAVLLISAGPRALLNRWLLGNRLMVGIGLISYPLYLWHWPVMAFIRISKDGELTQPYAIRAIVISTLLAWLTYRFVEAPFRRGPIVRKKILLLSIAMALLVVVGSVTFLLDGFPKRKAATIVDQTLLEEIRRHPKAFESDESCQALLGMSSAQEKSVVCLTSSHQPEFAIMGDSHGMAFNQAAILNHVPFNVLFMGRHGCLPFTEYTFRAPEEIADARGCREGAHVALEYIKQSPGIHTVLLATRGPIYFSGTGFGKEGKHELAFYDKEDKPIDAKEAFMNGYSRLVQQLLKSGKKVIFMVDWPELGASPKACIGSRLVSAGRSEGKSDCMNPRSIVDERQAEYRQLIGALQAKNPEMKVYDPLDIFCDENTCYGIKGTHVYYFDDDHISLRGSTLVIRDFQAWLGRE